MSGSSSQNSTSNQSSLSGCNNFGELSEYFESKYGLTFDESVKQLDFNTVKSSLAGIETTIKDCPDVGVYLTQGTTSSSGIMSCSGNKITFNPEYYSDSNTLSGVCSEQSSIGYWVPNSSPESIGVHEAAHGVEWAIIQANQEYETDTQRIRAWNECSEASRIVSEAVYNVQSTTYGSSKTPRELIKEISGYAQSNDSETMAEAFADVYANGSNAKPLSIEIRRIAQQTLSKYKGAL